MLRGIRQRSSVKRLAKRQTKVKMARGGALYTFDLNDKVGGLPARIPLNGTADGDCPGTDVKDLGFVNYGVAKGGARRLRSKKSKKSNKSKKNKKNNKTKKNNNNKARRSHSRK